MGNQNNQATDEGFFINTGKAGETFYKTQGSQGRSLIRPTSALGFHDQQDQAARLSQPKWKEIPFHKFLITSDRENMAKRKSQYQNRLFSCN
jgi:hypothetical protein